MNFEDQRKLSHESLRLLMQDTVKDEINEMLRDEIKNHPTLKPLLIIILYDELAELIADMGRARGSIKTKEEFQKLKRTESNRSAARLKELGLC